MPAQQSVPRLQSVSSRLVATRDVFIQTVHGLRVRSASWRESAAVWGGSISGDGREWKATAVWFHHELCDDRAGPLSLELSEAAKYSLYQHLASAGLRLVALVHTHPDEWVDLSAVDRRNQISSKLGFWSLVIPHYASKTPEPETFGIHVRIDRGWHRLGAEELGDRFRIET